MTTFRGGDKLQAKLAELAAIAGQNVSVRVGFLEGSTCGRNNNSSAPQVAYLLEHGTKFMPPRPFFRQMIDASSPAWGDALGKQITATGYEPEETMSRMGELLKQQLQQSIIDFDDPPDSDATIARKQFKHGASATLIDSGNMLNAVAYELGGEVSA